MATPVCSSSVGCIEQTSKKLGPRGSSSPLWRRAGLLLLDSGFVSQNCASHCALWIRNPCGEVGSERFDRCPLPQRARHTHTSTRCMRAPFSPPHTRPYMGTGLAPLFYVAHYKHGPCPPTRAGPYAKQHNTPTHSGNIICRGRSAHPRPFQTLSRQTRAARSRESRPDGEADPTARRALDAGKPRHTRQSQ